MAQIATAVIAGLALALSLWATFGDHRLSRTREWQRVVVYTVVEERSLSGHPAALTEIQLHYLQRAQQILNVRLSRKELQEAALRRILLDLQADGLVEQGVDGRYRLPGRSALDAHTADQLNSLLRERQIRPRVLKILERKSGHITREGLVRELSEADVHVSFDEIDNLLWNLGISPTMRVGPDGTITFSW
jgi:hypothetical protein